MIQQTEEASSSTENTKLVKFFILPAYTVKNLLMTDLHLSV